MALFKRRKDSFFSNNSPIFTFILKTAESVPGIRVYSKRIDNEMFRKLCVLAGQGPGGGAGLTPWCPSVPI